MTEQGAVPSQTVEKGEPDSPTDLPAPRWKDALKHAFKEFKADKGTMIAAGMAFFWFLSIFPALLAAVGITGLVNASQDTVNSISDAVKSTLPGDAAKVLTDALGQATSRSGGSSVVAALVGVVVAIWSASAGMVATQSGLDVVYDVPQERSYVKKRLWGLLMIVAAVVLGGIATAAIVFGAPIGEAIQEHIGFGETAFVVVWTLVRWVVGLLALSALFAAFYYLGPNRETPRWTWLSPGGAVATVIWLLASLGFSFYVSNLGSYGETYGSLTGVVVLLLWLYLSAIAILIGGEINAELERQAEKTRRQSSGGGSSGGGRPPRDEPRPVAAATAPQPVPSNSTQPDNTAADTASPKAWEEAMARIRGNSRS